MSISKEDYMPIFTQFAKAVNSRNPAMFLELYKEHKESFNTDPLFKQNAGFLFAMISEAKDEWLNANPELAEAIYQWLQVRENVLSITKLVDDIKLGLFEVAYKELHGIPIEADEISDSDLQASADMYDKLLNTDADS